MEARAITRMVSIRDRVRLCLLAGAVGLCAPMPALGQSLEAELQRLLHEHPQIRAAKQNAAAAKARISEAQSDYYPQIGLTADTGWERTNEPARRAAANGEPFEKWRDSGALTVTQNLFNGFRTGAGVRAAELAHDVAQTQIEATRQAVLFEAISSYLNVLRSQRVIEVSARNEGNIQDQLRLEDERVQRGSGITVDVLQAKSRLQLAKERRVAFEGRLRDSVARYMQVFDSIPEISTLDDVRPPEELVPASLEEALSLAETHNPQIKISNLQSESAQEQKTIAQSDYWPTINLVGSATYEDDVSTTIGIKREKSLLVRGTWDFFSGFRTRSRVEAAARTIQSTKDVVRYTHRKVLEEVRLSWEQLKTHKDRVTLLENAVNIALEVLDARKQLRESGKETALNVLDAESEVFNAQLNLFEADFDSRLAAYRLSLGTGMLAPSALNLSED